MLTLALAAGLLAVLVGMVVWQRQLTLLMTLASLLAGGLLLIWMQAMGLLPGTQGPLADRRPHTLQEPLR
ncbi:hypothetical protein [Methylobacterium sp. Leaf118]|uniref:hypothetical protein n=1 Tax=Methylobacterium sp. Leaf118 TaxID=2876562 RepID=UPI001E56E59A|nr:hypothetical protein [Methylobacterium sp. Leaf118]